MNQRKYRKGLAALAVLALGVGVTACGGSDSGSDTTVASSDTTGSGDGFTLKNFTPTEGATVVDCGPEEGQPLKAAWVYVGPINDGGWTQTHEAGRQYVQEALGDKIVTTYKENVPEGPQVETVIDDLVKDGNTLIFGTSYGFQDAFVAAAEKYPDVCFEFATGFKQSNNMSQFYGASEDTKYLSGIAAGAEAPEGASIGVVAPFAIPEVIRGINGFTLGVQKVNPTATVKVVWVNTWFDPAKERKAAESLIAEGVKAIASFQDSPATGEAAKEVGIGWVGYDSDQSEAYADIWLTASTYDWGPYELAKAQAILDGKWISGNYYGSLNDDFVGLANYGTKVSQETKDLIASERTRLTETPGAQFTGPITAQDGTVKIAEGAMPSYDDLMNMNYQVKGITTDLPKS